MDTTDPEIQFDQEGVCHHCHAYDISRDNFVFSGPVAAKKLAALVEEIKQHGKGKDYDCIIGVSGGVDSTYVAYKVKKLGLRPLAVHLDNGWDSEMAVKNIENTLNKLGIELHTHVINWEEFRDLQLSFLKASTPDSEIPSDHAIVSLMFQMAHKLGVTHVISGCNVRTESHLPRAWSRGHEDWRYIHSVHKLFGTVPLRTFPYRNILTIYRDRRKIKWIDILNLMDYSKKESMRVLQDELEWQYYGGKHYESIYTRFYQGYILPRKFGFDKRKTHLSSLICSGEITRAQALEELEGDPYPAEMQQQDREYVIKKLGISEKEFESIMNAPPKRYEDYPSYATSTVLNLLRKLRRLVKNSK
jgi:N-acetyl sugar amidotransferase